MTPAEWTARLAAAAGLTVAEYAEQTTARNRAGLLRIAAHLDGKGPDAHGNTAATFRKAADRLK
jgi:hypothetical protein